MNPTEFLHTALESISKNFPNIHIKYGYNTIINTHIVELLPIEEYQNNVALEDEWIPLSFKFRESYPEEEITFISSDSTLRIENSILEFNEPSFTFDISDFFAALSKNELNYSFPTCMPVGTISNINSITGLLNSPKQNVYEQESDLDTFYQAAA